MEKMFTVAGYSYLNGKLKLRFANDMVARYKLLNKKDSGHTNVMLVELPCEMNKVMSAKFLAERFQDPDLQIVIDEFLSKRKEKQAEAAEVV